ncbi:MAG: COP23 domain-containing protein [Almyronema sp.]
MGRLRTSLGVVAIALVGLASVEAAQAEAVVTFDCRLQAGVPTTVAQTSQGIVAVVQWSSNEIAIAPGATAASACEAATEQFQTYLATETAYITTGRMNGELVACAASQAGGGCQGRLFALQPEVRPRTALQRILQIRVPNDGPIEETGPRLYVSFARYLQGGYPALSVGEPSPASRSAIKLSPEVKDAVFQADV